MCRKHNPSCKINWSLRRLHYGLELDNPRCFSVALNLLLVVDQFPPPQRKYIWNIIIETAAIDRDKMHCNVWMQGSTKCRFPLQSFCARVQRTCFGFCYKCLL